MMPVCMIRPDGAAPAAIANAAGPLPAWRLRSHLELGALPGAVPCARLHARQVLWEWRLEGQADTIELLVSELVTNAVQASAGLGPAVASVRLWLCSDGHRVVVQVWDGCDRLPVRRDAEPDSAGGRGLLLVDSLSAQWGSYRPEGASGKVVWALVTSHGW